MNCPECQKKFNNILERRYSDGGKWFITAITHAFYCDFNPDKYKIVDADTPSKHQCNKSIYRRLWNWLIGRSASSGLPEITEWPTMPDVKPPKPSTPKPVSHPCEGCGRIGGRKPFPYAVIYEAILTQGIVQPEYPGIKPTIELNLIIDRDTLKQRSEGQLYDMIGSKCKVILIEIKE